MNIDTSNFSYHKAGQISCYMVFTFGVVYILITTMGLLSLQSSQEAIGDPYFSIMEILSIVISILMTVALISVHQFAAPPNKFFSLAALILMSITTVITSCVHFIILSVSHSEEAAQLHNFAFLFSFKWPSIVYALDILAWDLFFGLSMLFTIPIFNKNRFEKSIKALLFFSGILSLIGLVGIPLHNMQIRNIGIIGYALIGPFAFLLIGKILGTKNEVSVKS